MHKILIVFTVVVVSATAAPAPDLKAGKVAYDKSCKSCHGIDGTANPAISKMMKMDIANLGSAPVQAQSDANLKAIITDGKGKMSAVKTVSASDLDSVVAYVRSFKK